MYEENLLIFGALVIVLSSFGFSEDIRKYRISKFALRISPQIGLHTNCQYRFTKNGWFSENVKNRNNCPWVPWVVWKRAKKYVRNVCTALTYPMLFGFKDYSVCV